MPIIHPIDNVHVPTCFSTSLGAMLVFVIFSLKTSVVSLALSFSRRYNLRNIFLGLLKIGEEKFSELDVDWIGGMELVV
jgi:hypothetical protein